MISELLAKDRILVDSDGGVVQSKRDALRVLSGLLSEPLGVEEGTIERQLTERERLVSTGIGEGVAIPHTSVEAAPGHAAALLLCPKGIAFDSVDSAPVNIIFGVVGPKRASSEHLRTLARISRLLRNSATRERLVQSGDPETVLQFIRTEDEKLG